MADTTPVVPATTPAPMPASTDAASLAQVMTPATDATKAPGAKRNPLDILEDILDNAEAKKEETEAQAAQDRQAAELKAKEEEIRQQDLAKIEEERAKMSDIGSTPEEQARQSQQQEKTTASQQKQDDQQGYEIVQLGHTKI